MTHSVLITGGAGFIGRHAHAALERQGWSVISIDSQASRLAPNCLRCDITDAGQLEPIFRAHRFERIIHAASILPTAAKLDPHKATEVNIGGSLNILEMAARFHVQRVIYASSGSVYGTQSASNFVSEDQPAAPEDVYGAAKRYVEILGEAYERKFGVEFVALRMVMVVGAGGLRPHLPGGIRFSTASVRRNHGKCSSHIARMKPCLWFTSTKLPTCWRHSHQPNAAHTASTTPSAIA